MVFGSAYLFFHMPTGFIPSQDSGFLFGITKGGQDISFESMAAHHQAIVDILAHQPPVKDIAAFAGGGNQAFFFINMKPRAERNVSVDEFIDQMRPRLFGVPGILAFMQNPPPITVSGTFSTSVYQLTVQSASLKEIYAWAPQLMEKMRTLPGFQDVNSDMELSSPQLYVDIDRDRAFAVGVTPEQIQNALYTFYGQRQVSTIYSPANQYIVLLEVEPRYQRTPDALSKLYVRSSSGKLVPLDAVVTMRRTAGPLNVNHFGQLPAVTISFNLTTGSSLGDAAQSVENGIAELRMPPTVSTSFQGTVKQFQQSFQGLSILLIVAILVIYIVLGILYESFIHPITILSGLPAAVFGALLTLLIFHKQLDLYAFVGIIMLFGVVKKNAIMMIDFALEAQRVEGKDPYHAIYQGCLLRFRPIMMTTVAALFGTLPIAMGYGEGADARQPLGLAVGGGLVVSQFLTLYITPVIFLYMEQLQAALRGRKPAVAGSASEAPAGV
jgi:HAE1 family hydrophobic/amphiphilic exporter-1